MPVQGDVGDVNIKLSSHPACESPCYAVELHDYPNASVKHRPDDEKPDNCRVNVLCRI